MQIGTVETNYHFPLCFCFLLQGSGGHREAFHTFDTGREISSFKFTHLLCKSLHLSGSSQTPFAIPETEPLPGQFSLAYSRCLQQIRWIMLLKTFLFLVVKMGSWEYMFRCRYLQCEVRQNESKARNLLKMLLMSNRETNVKSVYILFI